MRVFLRRARVVGRAARKRMTKTTKTIDSTLVGRRVRVPGGKDAGLVGVIQKKSSSRGRYTIKLSNGTRRHGLDPGWIEKNLLDEDRARYESDQQAQQDALASSLRARAIEARAVAQEWDALIGQRVRLLEDFKLPASKSSAQTGGSGRYILIEAGEEGTLRCDVSRTFTVELDDATIVPLITSLAATHPCAGKVEAANTVQSRYS